MSETYDQMALDLVKLQRLNLLKDLLQGVVLKNLLLVGKPGDFITISVKDPNLYRLAVQYYGDANLWTTIAKAYGLSDPKYKNQFPIKLIIPPLPNSNTHGILYPV